MKNFARVREDSAKPQPERAEFANILVDVREEREYLRRERRKVGVIYVSANGLALLAEEGVKVFELQTGHKLPHNLVRTAMSGRVGNVGRYGRRMSASEANAEIASHARFGGWLKAAVHLPAVRRVLENTQACEGINSYRTTLCLWGLVGKFPSPGRFERLLWSARQRADHIVRAVNQEKSSATSWHAVASGLMADARPGKAGVIAAAAHLSGKEFKTYREARAYLVDLRLSKEVFGRPNIRLQETPEYKRFQVKVLKGVLREGYSRKLVFFVEMKGFECIIDRDVVDEKPEKALRLAIKQMGRARKDTVPARERASLMEITDIRMVDRIHANKRGGVFLVVYKIDVRNSLTGNLHTFFLNEEGPYGLSHRSRFCLETRESTGNRVVDWIYEFDERQHLYAAFAELCEYRHDWPNPEAAYPPFMQLVEAAGGPNLRLIEEMGLF